MAAPLTHARVTRSLRLLAAVPFVVAGMILFVVGVYCLMLAEAIGPSRVNAWVRGLFA